MRPGPLAAALVLAALPGAWPAPAWAQDDTSLPLMEAGIFGGAALLPDYGSDAE